MKKTLIVIAALAICTVAAAKGGSGSGKSSSSSHSVVGHTTKNGTYVAPHKATNPNGTKSDNWSHKGNVNPHTGKAGTKD